jgi:hypothetical protein
MFMPRLPHQRLLDTAIASPSQAITRTIKVEYTYSNGWDRENFPWLRKHEYDSQANFFMQYPQPAASSVMRSYFILLRSCRTPNHYQYNCLNLEIVTQCHFCSYSEGPGFKSCPENRLSWGLLCFPRHLQVNAKILRQNKAITAH